jgi:nicotinamide-nucleotide amidase
LEPQQLTTLAQTLGDKLHQRHWMFASAESCTGGWLGKVATDIPGSSSWFERGFITYTNVAKQEMLGVPQSVLQQHGAVSEPVALAMAEGAIVRSHAQLSVAITGIAGPGGGSEEKPVGTVCFAWAGNGISSHSQTRYFDGDREAVRMQAVAEALQGLHRILDGK